MSKQLDILRAKAADVLRDMDTETVISRHVDSLPAIELLAIINRGKSMPRAIDILKEAQGITGWFDYRIGELAAEFIDRLYQSAYFLEYVSTVMLEDGYDLPDEWL